MPDAFDPELLDGDPDVLRGLGGIAFTGMAGNTESGLARLVQQRRKTPDFEADVLVGQVDADKTGAMLDDEIGGVIRVLR